MEVFRKNEEKISTVELTKGLTSDAVLAIVRDDLVALGFEVEGGKKREDKIERPVFFGENGSATLRYQIDAYNPDIRCGLEVEAGRALMGNAVYRDLVQAMVMVQVDHLVLAVPNTYKFTNQNKLAISRDYESARDIADALFGHTRVTMPYKLTLIGY